jgi:hypothetical protein
MIYTEAYSLHIQRYTFVISYLRLKSYVTRMISYLGSILLLLLLGDLGGSIIIKLCNGIL